KRGDIAHKELLLLGTRPAVSNKQAERSTKVRLLRALRREHHTTVAAALSYDYRPRATARSNPCQAWTSWSMCATPAANRRPLEPRACWRSACRHIYTVCTWRRLAPWHSARRK